MSRLIVKLVTAWQLVAKRSLFNWRLLSAVVLGVLLASAIMAGTVIYFDALREMALRSTLDKLSITETNILVQGEKGPTNREEYGRVAAVAEAQIAARVAWMLRDSMRAGKSPTFFLAEPGKEHLAGEDNARSYFAFLPQLDEHITLMPGSRTPSDRPLSLPGEPLEIEAMIPREASVLFGVGIGDRLVGVPHWDDVIPQVTVVVTGIFTRNDASDEFWHLEDRVLDAATGPSFRTVPFFISEQSYLDVLGPAFRKMASTYAWLLAVDDGRINARNSDTVLADVETMHRLLAATLSAYRQETELDDALRGYDRRLFFSKLPMFVVLILIAVVILYYVATLSSLTVEERRSEVALLCSRGASSVQILTVFVLEGATVALIAIFAGPFLAAASVSALGYTPAFADLGGGGPLAVSISAGAYVMSTVGGILSFVALIVPAVQASRIGVTRHRQEAARPASQPAFQRYYLDVLLLLVSIFLFRQLTEQGSVVATRLFGEMAVNQLLLALPGLMLVASAMVLLRLFPLLMNLGSRVFSSWLPAGMVMGVWQMARNPTHYARLSLLLMLTAGLGIFASSFGATLERSFEERVLYATGSDVRVDDVRERFRITERARRFRGATPTPTPVPLASPTPRPTMTEAFQEVEGVQQVSVVLRNTGHDLSKTWGESYTMFAMDGESFSDVAWFRDDFSRKPMKNLLESLKPAAPPRGIVLPEDARKLAVRIRADRPHSTVRLTARIINARSRYSTYTLGVLDSSEWVVMEVDLSFGTRQHIQSSLPLTLVSLRIEETGIGRRLQAGSIIIDEISIATESGETVVIEPFDDISSWTVLKVSSESISDLLRRGGASYESDSGSAMFTWSSGSALVSRGLFHGTAREPLPVLASKSFIRATGHFEGEEFEVSVGGFRVPVRVVDAVEYFPTMTTPNQKYLISDLASLTRYANLGASFRQLDANELWISTAEDGEQGEGVAPRIVDVRAYTSTSIHDRKQLLAESKVDPLVKAGWRSLLFIAFAAVLILSCLGFLVHAYVSFRSRQLQFALLRTVGFSRRQLITMVWLEQVLVIATGLALGTWMGGRLGAIIMPFLGHDDFGGQVVPPFALEVNWGALLITYGFMVAVFALITLGIVWLIHRISIQDILRLGEM